ncbi:MAG: hypothetical protein PHZ07_05005 [Patescibacteria group bacterium]|nr:hypothetical protein [Patescibacteria group bacterium]MDD4304761.1 hypothetical protein [Patescibacteria group bacterium]MDD4695772.1 hypothetical protein [Patescibacteria group bacterium]
MNDINIENKEKKVTAKKCCINFLNKKYKILGRSKKIKLITDAIFIVIATIVIALLINMYYLNQYKRNIILDINTENQDIVSGSIEKFELKYKNNNKEDIENVNIEVMLPENFKITNVIPNDIFDKNTNTFQIGKIEEGVNGKIEISGLIIGEINTQQKILFRLNYKKQGISQSAISSLIYNIKDSKLKTNINIPEKIYKDTPFDAQIMVENTSENTFENVKIKLTCKDLSIIKIYSQSDININNNIITIKKIESNEKININLNLFTNNENSIELLLENFISYSKDKDYKQNELKKVIEIQKPKFEINIKSDQTHINDSEKAKFQIYYTNHEDIDIKNAKIKIISDTNSSVKNINILDNNNFYLKNNEIIFKNYIKKDEIGKIDIELNILRKNLNVNQETYIILENEYYRDTEIINYKTYSSKIKFLSNLNISSKAYYYSEKGDQLGIGPLPPAVGIPTKYWIFWKVDNFGNDLSNFSMSAELPENVTWTGNKSVLEGNLQYSETNKRIIWNLDKINKNNAEYKIGFEVSIIPKTENIGYILQLLKNVEYSTKDNFCDIEISKNLENLDTNLKYDIYSSGKGKVIELK